ncbi:MAG TPA: NEW3 domain-containing protein [Jiangellaceae bacterium]|nr:NEW3 domain-containing protein [Jiangellaceae bacterium]
MKGTSRIKILSAAFSGLLLVPLATATPAAAVELVTPYPAVAAEPGQTSTFDLQVTSDESELVQLRVTGAPEGWDTVLRGDGREVSAVHASANEPREVQLDISVPADAAEGDHRVTVTATGDGGRSTLPLTLTIVEQAAEAFEFTADFPSLQGSATDTFRFDLTLANRSGREATFSLAAAGPEGWTVSARPSTEQQAATVTVEAGGSATINVEADPPDDVAAGQYELGVQASGEGQTLQSSLSVEITDSASMSLTTANERLNASGNAGDTGTVTLLVQNDGNAPLQGIELSATPPTNWDVEFEPATMDIPAGESAQVIARITPAGNAVAGDYAVTITAAGGGLNESVEIRYAVETSGWWGLVGILVIAGAIAALVGVYRRYGRR